MNSFHCSIKFDHRRAYSARVRDFLGLNSRRIRVSSLLRNLQLCSLKGDARDHEGICEENSSMADECGPSTTSGYIYNSLALRGPARRPKKSLGRKGEEGTKVEL